MVARRRPVDGPARVLGDDRVAVGREELPLDRHADRPPAVRGAGGEEGGVARADLGVHPEGVGRDRPRENLDDPAQGVVAVEGGAAAGHDLDPVDAEPGDRAPVDPAAEGVVGRDAVDQDQAAGDPRGADAAEVHSLGGRVGDDAARPPEEPEGGDDPEELVDGLGRAPLDLPPRQDRDRRRHVAQRAGPARRRDHDLRQHRGRLRPRGPGRVSLPRRRPFRCPCGHRAGHTRPGDQRGHEPRRDEHPPPSHGSSSRVPGRMRTGARLFPAGPACRHPGESGAAAPPAGPPVAAAVGPRPAEPRAAEPRAAVPPCRAGGRSRAPVPRRRASLSGHTVR